MDFIINLVFAVFVTIALSVFSISVVVLVAWLCGFRISDNEVNDEISNKDN